MAPMPIVALAAAIFLSGPMARATDFTLHAQLCLPGLGADKRMSDCEATALLTTPAGWQSGDAAVVLLATGSAGDVGRDPLIAALIEAHTAVLELHPAPLGPSTGYDPGPGNPGIAAGFVRALAALRRQAGAGRVVAIGYGDGARGALDAVEETEPGRLAGGDHFAGAVALGTGAAWFLRGAGEPLPSIPLGVVCSAIAVAEGRPRSGIAAACFTVMARRGLTSASLHW